MIKCVLLFMIIFQSLLMNVAFSHNVNKNTEKDPIKTSHTLKQLMANECTGEHSTQEDDDCVFCLSCNHATYLVQLDIELVSLYRTVSEVNFNYISSSTQEIHNRLLRPPQFIA